MSEGRLLFKMVLPMIFSVLVSSLYNIMDSIFVGRLCAVFLVRENLFKREEYGFFERFNRSIVQGIPFCVRVQRARLSCRSTVSSIRLPSDSPRERSARRLWRSSRRFTARSSSSQSLWAWAARFGSAMRRGAATRKRQTLSSRLPGHAQKIRDRHRPRAEPCLRRSFPRRPAATHRDCRRMGRAAACRIRDGGSCSGSAAQDTVRERKTPPRLLRTKSYSATPPTSSAKSSPSRAQFPALSDCPSESVFPSANPCIHRTARLPTPREPPQSPSSR